jgi:diguanylate cyclase (GGDEF)-like protein
VGGDSGYWERVAVSGHRDGGGTRDALSPSEGYAPIAILDFLANAESVVRRLGEQTCVPNWVLTRRFDHEWVVLAGHGDHGLRPGDALDHRLGAAGHLARLAARWEREVVVDLELGHIRRKPDRAASDGTMEASAGLVAFPLWDSDGLFGAVCALPEGPGQEAALRRSEPLVELTIELLSAVLDLDLDRSRLQRRLDAAQSAALSDPLTALGNRRAFDRAVEKEEARCARFGHLAGVMILDLDGLKVVNDTDGHDAGDHLLQRAATTIRNTLRSADQAFRIGGDEFALLLPEVTVGGLDGLRERLTSALAEVGVSASIGCAIRRPGGDLHDSAREADASMYERKRGRGAVADPVPGRPQPA